MGSFEDEGTITHTDGLSASWNYKKCGCPECKEVWAAYTRELRKRRKEETSNKDIPHGVNGYSNYGCKCRTCRGAHAAYDRERQRYERQRAIDLRRERELERRAAAGSYTGREKGDWNGE